MSEFGDRSSEKYTENIEEIECPFCKKGKIKVSFIAGYTSWRKSSISAGSKQTRYFHDPRIKIHNKCPNCGASKSDIKEAIEKGVSKESHEEKLKRFKNSGIPTMIEIPIKKDKDWEYD
ncbi:MAG: hypothetical protein ABIH55_01615 [Nanoarchaeota archaeon]